MTAYIVVNRPQGRKTYTMASEEAMESVGRYANWFGSPKAAIDVMLSLSRKHKQTQYNIFKCEAIIDSAK